MEAFDFPLCSGSGQELGHSVLKSDGSPPQPSTEKLGTRAAYQLP